MPEFACDFCLAKFTRPNHLARHRGTKRCLLNRVAKKKSTAAMGKKTRGVADGGNVNRTIRNNCGPFVRFLKKNVQKARLERKVFNQIVSFVPYDDMYTAEDIARMSSAMKQILGRITAKNRPHAIVLAISTAVFFTPKAVTVVGMPVLPWSEKYEKGLRERLMLCRRDGDTLCNPAIIAANTKSFKHKPLREAKAVIEKIIALLKRVSLSVPEGIQKGLDAKDPLFDYVGAFACTGVPHDGYTMNLASCFWRHGLGQEAYFGSEAREYFPFEASNTGTAKGIAKLSGATLQNHVSPDAVYDKQK
jgi:hypothetical protein